MKEDIRSLLGLQGYRVLSVAHEPDDALVTVEPPVADDELGGLISPGIELEREVHDGTDQRQIVQGKRPDEQPRCFEGRHGPHQTMRSIGDASRRGAYGRSPYPSPLPSPKSNR